MSDLAPEGSPARSADSLPGPDGPVLERLSARSAEVGVGLTIRRALPHPQRRLVGPWCFLDHAGPIHFGAAGGLAVGPHPHIGLQTFTWMIEGAVVHRDSLGNEQRITPGQVNLMTAGRGIAHAEDSDPASDRLHAVQLWIALPESERRRSPWFRNYPHLPLIERSGFTVRVLAGAALGELSPAEVYSPLIALDIAASAPARTELPLDAQFEHAVLVLEGELQVEHQTLGPGVLLYLGTSRSALEIRCASATRFMLVGGAPFKEEVLVWWNFVARTAEEIEAATRDWNAGQGFGAVDGSPSPPLVAPDVSGLRLRARPNDGSRRR